MIPNRLILLLLFCLSLSPRLFGQAEAPVIFPPERHEELRQEISFVPPVEEEEEEKEEPAFDFNWDFDLSPNVSIAIFSVLLLGFGFLIYRMLDDVSLRGRIREKSQEEGVNIEELEEERLVAEGVSLSLLQRAENAEQFDVAVRLLYLQLLKELQDATLIKYRRDYSNRDYQRQLRDTEFLRDFRDITADYERYWYGKYPVDRLSYRLVQRKFNVLNQSIKAATTEPDPYV
ncbi:MAG: DUF4129 domain-containing protein [Bacteroidota bacterium]